MGLYRLVWKNITGKAFRSLAISLCAALVAGLALSATFVVRGAEASLRSNLDRLGAELLVLPWGTMTDKIEGIRLMSAAIEGWMPRAYMAKVAALPGVEQVSPQLYLATIDDSPYSPYPQMYLVAFDPVTDFTLRPWRQAETAKELGIGEAVAGAHISLPEGGDRIKLYGVELKQVDRLAATQTTIDNTLFVSFETAQEMIAWSRANRDAGLAAMPDSITAMMVRLEIGSDPHEAALQILEQVPGVVPLETPNLFQTERRQMIGVLRTLLGALAGIWILVVVFLGLVFSIAVNERRYEIGVLRALGFSGRLVLRVLLLEGAALALAGGLTGVLLAAFGFAALGDQIAGLARLPLYLPSALELVSLSLGGQALALLSVTLAAFLPAWRISQEDVAITMRV